MQIVIAWNDEDGPQAELWSAHASVNDIAGVKEFVDKNKNLGYRLFIYCDAEDPVGRARLDVAERRYG